MALSEIEVCDLVVEWFREYRDTVGFKDGVQALPLRVLNSRWGRALRRFGPTIREVLSRDARFSLFMNDRGGMDVAVRVGTRAEAEAARDALKAMFRDS